MDEICSVLFSHLNVRSYDCTEVPGYGGTMSRHPRPMTGLERSLYKLNAVRELGAWANEYLDLEPEEDSNDDGKGVFITADKNQPEGSAKTESSEKSATKIPSAESDNVLLLDDQVEEEAAPTFFAQPCVTSAPKSSVGEKRQDSVIVIIRHGKTQVRFRKHLWLVIDVERLNTFTNTLSFAFFSSF